MFLWIMNFDLIVNMHVFGAKSPPDWKIMPWSLGMQSLWKLYLNFYVDDMLKSVKYEEEVVELEN